MCYCRSSLPTNEQATLTVLAPAVASFGLPSCSSPRLLPSYSSSQLMHAPVFERRCHHVALCQSSSVRFSRAARCRYFSPCHARSILMCPRSPIQLVELQYYPSSCLPTCVRQFLLYRRYLMEFDALHLPYPAPVALPRANKTPRDRVEMSSPPPFLLSAPSARCSRREPVASTCAAQGRSVQLAAALHRSLEFSS
jgi:hypothetical protein